jgi:short-subunit dehydrogenase
MSSEQTEQGASTGRRLAVVTGATAGIGHELARVFAREGFDVVVSAEDDRVDPVAAELRAMGVAAYGVRVDLATAEGCATLATEVEALGRPVDALALNAGVGVSGPFLESGTLEDQLNVIDLDVKHPVRLAHRLIPAMVARGEGRVLITSSIVATVAAPYQATYSGSKAFLQSFAEALRVELQETGVTVTALQPGGTDTEFWTRSGAEQQDTKVTDTKFDDPAEVAREGYDALMAGKDHVVTGRRVHPVLAKAGAILPDAVTSKLSARLTKPGTSSKKD